MLCLNKYCKNFVPRYVPRPLHITNGNGAAGGIASILVWPEAERLIRKVKPIANKLDTQSKSPGNPV
ncbi:unnamed protein product [Rhizophagus irregularis]|nr:unnamed protein product [Rhizophagus irregularis]CAB5383644.1 unnamed protein product [Rhizophagus irregularis]